MFCASEPTTHIIRIYVHECAFGFVFILYLRHCLGCCLHAYRYIIMLCAFGEAR